MERICQREFNAEELVTSFPPRLSDQNKKIVFDMSAPAGAVHTGTISFSRWLQILGRLRRRLLNTLPFIRQQFRLQSRSNTGSDL